MRFLFLSLITLYQWCLRPLLGVGHCRFYPSCSEYAKEAVQQHGAWRGAWLAVRRLGCCHPYHPGGYDPVPEDGRTPYRCKHPFPHPSPAPSGHSLPQGERDCFLQPRDSGV
ncbi:MAG: membrane protein insertion efficiency factor YidD [Burkholderiales bacterium]|nr:membrane protein insertion efficiency factor YidD [Burkholderiales bacterium]